VRGPKLTFNSGQFFLEGLTPYPTSRKTLDRDSRWVRVDDDLFVTTNIVAAAKYRERADKVCTKVFSRAFNEDYCKKVLPLHALSFLDPLQKEGVHWVLSRKRAYLAHAPGAGKTAQAIVSAFVSKCAKTLFIVPPSLIENWHREILKFYNLLKVKAPEIGIIRGTADMWSVNWDAPIMLCPDSMLAAAWVHREFQTYRDHFVAVDEASRLKEPTSERSRIFFGGVVDGENHFGIYQKAKHVVFLDGSPMPNRPMELWGPVYALDPEAIDGMDQRDFGFRYCAPHLNDRGNYLFSGSSNEYELRAKLRARLMHVVTEDQLNHPERLRSMVFLADDVRTQAMKAWERTNLTNFSMKDLDEDASQGDLATYRLELGIRKVPLIAQYVSERMEAGKEKVLLFVWHREVAELLVQKLAKYKPGLVIGGTSANIREDIFDKFQNGNTDLIVGNIGAMGRGHNLQKADRAVFGEFSWSDETNKQCEKRASRRGRDGNRAVRCDYLVAPYSIDEPILQALFTKERRVKRVIG
jgi:SWI/SNF-related matrix-associated actin-dependent regulator of chromatin subfamily A-like protein 1